MRRVTTNKRAGGFLYLKRKVMAIPTQLQAREMDKFREDEEGQVGVNVMVSSNANITYVAGTGADEIIKASAGFLYAVIIGKFVSGGIVEVSDHASDGDGNVKVYLETAASDTGFPKVIPVNANFATGITADLTASQTNVAFIWR